MSIDSRGRLIEGQKSLHELMRSGALPQATRKEAFRVSSKRLSEHLTIDRATLWLFDESRTAMAYGEAYLRLSDSFVEPAFGSDPRFVADLTQIADSSEISSDDCCRVASTYDVLGRVFEIGVTTKF